MANLPPSSNYKSGKGNEPSVSKKQGGNKYKSSNSTELTLLPENVILGAGLYPGTSLPLVPLPDMTKPFHEAEILEYNEQFYAQIAAMAVQVPSEAIQEGIRMALMRNRKERKTKADWNAERVRDFRVMQEGKSVGKPIDAVLDEIDLHGGMAGYSAMMPATDPIPYLANYDYDSFKDTLRHINKKHANFASIRILDLCGQLIGDSKLSDLCYQLRRCPITILNLSKNNLTDKGLTQLSTCLRSLGSLEALLLQHNNFSDAGVEALLQPTTYSPTMKKLDLSCNSLGTRAAFAIGRMFRQEIHSQLDELYLGGRVGKKGWGDEFLRILVDLLCRKGARPIRVFSYPHAALTPDGIRTLSSLLVCGVNLQVLNISKNTLQEPLSRRFLRDALRANRSLREVYLGSAGITREERNTLEEAALSRKVITFYEQMVLTYETCKELNYCGKLGHALEVVITNNWQATKPPTFPVLEQYIPTKEDMVRTSSTSTGEEDGAKGNGEKDDIGAKKTVEVLIPIPLTFLTSNMRLSESLVTALDKVDGVVNYITTIKRNSIGAIHWLQENVETFRMVGEQKFLFKKSQWRDQVVTMRRNALLITLEKWTSISLAKIIVCVDGKIRKVKEKSAKGKKSWSKPGKKAGKINAESVTMAIEELHSSYIELADALQRLIGVSFAIKLRFQDIHNKVLTGKWDIARNGGVEGIAKQSSKSTAVAGLLPYSELLGCASLYIHYIYVAGPEELERVKRSQIAFERDQKRQEDVAVKSAKKLATAGLMKKGRRFRVLRNWEREERNALLGYDPQAKADEERRLARQKKEREEAEEKQRLEDLRIRAEEEAGGAEESDIAEEDSEDDESEEEEAAEVTDKGKVKARERTRFLVPKREMQKKYEGLYTEDLLADKAGTKNGIIAFARANRNHIVNGVPFHMEMPAYEPHSTRTVPVDIIVEVEEERADALQSLIRIESIRAYVRLQERVRHRKATNKYIREELVGAL